MDEKKVTILEQRYYFELIPHNKYHIIKKQFEYDKEKKLYYSNNPDDIEEYKIKYVDLFHLADEFEMKYNKEKKRWYTYKGNSKIDEMFYE